MRSSAFTVGKASMFVALSVVGVDRVSPKAVFWYVARSSFAPAFSVDSIDNVLSLPSNGMKQIVPAKNVPCTSPAYDGQSSP